MIEPLTLLRYAACIGASGFMLAVAFTASVVVVKFAIAFKPTRGN